MHDSKQPPPFAFPGKDERQTHRAFRVAMTAAALLVASLAFGQDFPSKPIRMITVGTGGTADFVTRLLAQGVTTNTGAQVVVDNRGGSLVIPVQVAAKLPSDGYALLVMSNGMWTLPLMQRVSYDAVQDFAPVTLAVTSPILLVVHPSLPTKTTKELIALAKSRPDQLNYATGPTGTTNHIAGEMFMSMAGVSLVRIAYNGTGPALTDLLTGQVQVMFANVAPVAPLVKAGRLRALGVTSAASSSLFPELPPLAAAGLPGYETESVIAVFAPAKTPAAIVSRLNQEFLHVLNTPDVKEKLLNNSVEVIAGGPDRLAAFVKADIVRMTKVLKDTAGVEKK
jgi:tripartite-type tricarboxylate transporter receptor subunit TctC